jgi:hypothetical protein
MFENEKEYRRLKSINTSHKYRYDQWMEPEKWQQHNRALREMPRISEDIIDAGFIQFSEEKRITRINRLCLEMMCQPKALWMFYDGNSDMYWLRYSDQKWPPTICIPDEYYAQDFDWTRWRESDVLYPHFQESSGFVGKAKMERWGLDPSGCYQIAVYYDDNANWLTFRLRSAKRIEEF